MTEYHTSIVQLYATALFDYAVEQNMLNKISAEVTKFQSILLHDDRIIEVIAAPIHSEQDQAQLLQKIASFSNLSQEITNFIIFVAKNKRLLLV